MPSAPPSGPSVSPASSASSAPSEPSASARRTERATSDKWNGLRKNNLKRKGVNRMAIAALVTGILLFPVPIIALCCGGSAMNQIRRTRQKGASLAVVGIVLGVVGCLLWTAYWLAILFTGDANIVDSLTR